MEVAAQFSLRFADKNVSPEKTEQNVDFLRHRFSRGFHQNDRTVFCHLILVNDDLENVGQGLTFKRCSFF